MTRPRSDLEAPREDLHSIYDGDPWHGSSITEVLNGVDADVAARRSFPDAHTIWEIVLAAGLRHGWQPETIWPTPRKRSKRPSMR